ncbi:hypothetical protein CUMW_031180, partial [Citrus unshiu]
LFGKVIDTFPYILSEVFYLICSVILDFDNIYHAFLGLETFEEYFSFFGYTLYFRDLYDSWAPRDGERLEKLPTQRLVQVFVLVE